MRRRFHLSLLSLAVLAAAGRASVPDYEPMLLHELAGYAQLVVTGTIVEVGETTYRFEIEEVVAGEAPGARIEVHRFQNWICAGRWAEYETGQQMLLFLRRVPLRKRREGAGDYHVLSAGNEGEMPFLGDAVVSEGGRMEDYPTAEHDVAGNTVMGSLVPRAELQAAVRRYRELFKVRSWTYRDWAVQLLGTPEEIEAFANSSSTARHLVEASRSSLGYRDPARPLPARKRLGSQERMHFSVPRTRFGYRLSSCEVLGDLDGDGREEIVLGAAGDDEHGLNHGALWLLMPGEDRDLPRKIRIDENTPGFEGTLREHSCFGTGLAALGDLDGDGTLELAVSATGYADGFLHDWSVRILSLAADGSLAGCVRIDRDHSIFGGRLGPHVKLAEHLAAVGDVNGDGIGDLAVSEAPVSSLEMRMMGVKSPRAADVDHETATMDEILEVMFPPAKPGAVWILFLGRDFAPRAAQRIGALPDRMLTEDLHHDDFRGGLSSPGDLDGDGIPELAVGDWTDDDGGRGSGAVWILFLDRHAKERRRQKISAWHGGFTGLLRGGPLFGWSLAAPGDVDGDGIPDLVVGARDDPDGGSEKGALWVLFLRRDGTVRAHTKISDVQGGFTDVLPRDARLGQSLTAFRGGAPRLLAVSDQGSRENYRPILWLLDLAPDGTVLPVR